MTKEITRRQFLTYTAAGVGATVLACSGLGAIAFRPPALNTYEKLSANRNPANPTILVAYGSRASSTMKIAQTIAFELLKRNFTVDIRPIQRVTDLKGYNYVVIGSAIRMSSPLPEVMAFLEQFSTALLEIPTAFFAVYLMNSENTEVSNKARLSYLDPVRKLLPLQHEAYFTGVFDPQKVSFIEGVMGKMLKSPIGDFIDWDAISNWSQAIFTY